MVAGCSNGPVSSVSPDGNQDAGGEAHVAPDVPVTDVGAGDVDAGVPCKSHEECASKFEDYGPCMLAMCDSVSHTCVLDARKDGTGCEDDDACTQDSYCMQGECTGGWLVTCDDGNACTSDSCKPETGCAAQPLDGGTCDDGDPCTANDSCKASACTGEELACDCDSDEDCAVVGDSNLCNGVVACIESKCRTVEGSAVVCPPSLLSCQANVCDPATGACAPHQLENGAACSDDDPCSQGDVCQDGECKSGSKYVCEPCAGDQECSYLTDDAPCAPEFVCNDSKCTPDEEAEDKCKPAQCKTATCDPETGSCLESNLPDGTWCDDADACTAMDRCASGNCGGTTVLCDDGNGCTQDVCKKESGCFFTPLSGPDCDDGDACTASDSCEDGICTGKDPVSCEDADPCTEDLCKPDSGCVFEPLTNTPCEDGDPCTAPDTCSFGSCLGGAPACMCTETVQCAPYEDFNLCDGVLKCIDNVCIEDPETVIICDPSLNTPCDTNTCNPFTGKCVLKTNPYGSPCSDGNECTLGDACFYGVCTGGIAKSCDDGNPCSQDLCDPVAGCTSQPLTGPGCGDGFICTVDDSCVEGGCVGGVNTCPCEQVTDCAFYEDGDACNGTLHCPNGFCIVDPATIVTCPPAADECRTNQCDPSSGVCAEKAKPAGMPCDDGDACTQQDSCYSGDCVGQSLSCDDGKQCTKDSCDVLAGCQNIVLTGDACDDGNSCTVTDECSDGTCAGADNHCPCTETSECEQHEDDDLCNGTLSCVDGFCVTDLETIVKCDTSLDAPCKKALCDPSSGICELAVFPDGMACDDGQGCTEEDACQNGECSGYFKPCDDGNPCTDDACDPDKDACVWIPNTKPCDDSDQCTAQDACSAGECSGVLVSCDDGQQCTIDFCTAKDGCMNAPAVLPCDDGDACTGGDTCHDGKCVGQPLTCLDENPCTTDACDPQAGCTYYQADVECEDGDLCTVGDWCVKGECKPGPASACDDGDSCTEDLCQAGKCDHLGVSGVPCDDGLKCTSGDSCTAGECIGPPTVCDDGDVCTTDACTETSGCTHSFGTAPCDDADICTTGDACKDGICLPGVPASCDDGEECTTDSCVKPGRCKHAPLSGQACDDGDPCTLDDKCSTGKCSGKSDPCDDLNPCTTDSCEPGAGCIHAPSNGAFCSDGNVCTIDDACLDGKCVGSPKTCSDNDVCTQNLCDAVQGCFYPPVADAPPVSCSDNNKCTQTDVCTAGKCVGSNLNTCDDGLFCTKDTCAPATGSCSHENITGPCDDGNPCTTGDVCSGNLCKGFGSLSCNDGNACTDDSCEPSQGGCIHVPNTLSCEDENDCTHPDKCSGGQCVPGVYICDCENDADCDDDNLCDGILQCVNHECKIKPNSVVTCPPAPGPCASYKCQPATGACKLAYEPITTPCTDSNQCTTGDHCNSQGGCMGTSIACNDNNPCTTDTCNPASGCVYTNNTVGCTDANPCTVDDVCSGGICKGTPYLCNDSNSCTSDACVVENNLAKCFYSPISGGCNDSNECTVDDACVNGACTGSPLDCNDGNVCTNDSCNPQSGCVHSNNGYVCNDNQKCTLGDKCTVGQCIGTPKQCEDGNVCTTDSCDPADGECKAVFNSNPCNDGQACTLSDTCVGGVCTGSPKPCGDNNVCTDDGCDPTTGNCTHTFNTKPCDDLDSCTSPDVCSNGTCKGLWLFECCHSASDCQDDVDCTIDQCVGGKCKYSAKECDDLNACTADYCVVGAVCKAASMVSPVPLYLAGFEAGGLGWKFRVNGTASQDIFWSVSDHRAFAGTKSLYVGNPDDQSYDHGVGDATAISRAVRLAAGTTNTLTFKYWADLAEANCLYDHLDVEVEEESGVLNPLLPQVCQSTGNLWVTASYDLSPWGGKSVRLRFNFRTGDNVLNNAEGIYLDEVSLLAGPKADCCTDDSHCSDFDLCTEDDCKSFTCGYSNIGGSYFTEDFETGKIPVGLQSETDKWYIVTNSQAVTWQVDSKRSFNTPFSLYAGDVKSRTYDGPATDTSARTPAIYVPANSTPALTFRHYTQLAEANCNDVLEVRVATTPWSNGTQVWKNCASLAAWPAAEVSLKDYKGLTIYVIFRLVSNATLNNAEGVYVDYVRVVDIGNAGSCCTASKACEDNDTCTINTCDGVPGGGVCLVKPVTNLVEHFDDGKADGWTLTTNNKYVTWHVDNYRSVTSPNSLYCGGAGQTYIGYGAGTVTASTPYVLIDDLPGMTPLLSFARFLDLASLSASHCFTVTAKTSDQSSEVQLSKVCSGLVDKPSWNNEMHDLTAYMGKQVRISFTLSFGDTGGLPGGTPEGAYVDNVKLVFKGCD